MAGISLALAFTFGCSSSDDSGGSVYKSSSSNSLIAASSSSSKQSSSSSEVASSSSFGESSSTSEVASSSSFGESSSTSEVASSSSFGESSSSVSEGCEDVIFNPLTSFCYEDNVYSKCNGMVYNPTTHICQGTVANPAKCDGILYNPLENGCCVSILFNLATQKCQNSIVEIKCGTSSYNPETQFCVSNSVYSKCNNREYDPSYQRCQNNVVETKCGNKWYDANANLRCENNIIETKCGSGWYDATNANLRCENNIIEAKCGDGWYNALNANFSCMTDTRDSKSYKIAVIGTQTWMAENLNYNASGSKCYGEGGEVYSLGMYTTLSSTQIQANCKKYGRLYDWATAMILPSSCKSNSCASQINAKHKGICPTGWHIPSDADWNVLMKFVNPSCDDSRCDGAGTKLKATEDWSSYSGIPTGTDDYGFSALPGGRFFDGRFVGNYLSNDYGYWWSTSEYGSYNAYYRVMYYNAEYVLLTYNSKGYLQSVRCVQD